MSRWILTIAGWCKFDWGQFDSLAQYRNTSIPAVFEKENFSIFTNNQNFIKRKVSCKQASEGSISGGFWSTLFLIRFFKPANHKRFEIFHVCYVHELQCYPRQYWKPIEIYCRISLHQGSGVPRCWYMKLLLPLLKVKYYSRWHKLTILSIHTFNKFNSPPISRKSWAWQRILCIVFMPSLIFKGLALGEATCQKATIIFVKTKSLL